MIRISIFYLIAILVSHFNLSAQEIGSDATLINKRTASDQRKEYQEQLKRFDRINRMREKDPQRFMDSIKKVNDDRLRLDAIDRVEVYKSIADRSHVKEIDLSNAGYESIPSFIYAFDSLEVLVLDNNNIRELPKDLNKFKNLKRIYWRNNQLAINRVKIAKIGPLEKLDLSGNKLSKLPRVNRIEAVHELVVKNNALKSISLWRLRKIKNLSELDLSQNPIEMKKRWYGLVKDLKVLKLNKCNLDAIDPSIYKISGLKELQAQGNNLTGLPDGISELNNLTKISFYKNQLSSLPVDFYDLENLSVLDLYYNNLQVIPSDIERLKNLSILYLSFNKIYDLSESIGKLTRLSQLYIHHNRLSELPQSIAGLESLRTLHFQENYINAFPYFILSMDQIRDLDISFNDIGDIPLEIENLGLKSFYWRGLDIDFEDPDNYSLGQMIQRMDERGVVISPRINLQ